MSDMSFDSSTPGVYRTCECPQWGGGVEELQTSALVDAGRPGHPSLEEFDKFGNGRSWRLDRGHEGIEARRTHAHERPLRDDFLDRPSGCVPHEISARHNPSSLCDPSKIQGHITVFKCYFSSPKPRLFKSHDPAQAGRRGRYRPPRPVAWRGKS